MDITKRRLRKIAEAEMLMGMYIKTCPRCGENTSCCSRQSTEIGRVILSDATIVDWFEGQPKP